MSIPVLASTFAGTVFGAVDGVNTTFLAPYVNIVPLNQMLFRNGVFMTPGLDYILPDVFSVRFAGTQVPRTGDVVSEAIFDVNDATVPLPLNAPTLYSSIDGTLAGAIDGVNNIFVPATGLLVTDMIVFRNGVMQTQDVDYIWICLQVSSAGPWLTSIMMMRIPHPGDVMSAQVFGQ